MSKRNRNKNRGVKVETVELGGGTILEQFQRYIKNHRKVSDIITFLSVKNAELIGLTAGGELSEKLKSELYEFYDYYFDNYDDLTFTARIENWGQEPFIFRLTEELMDEDEAVLEEEYMNTLPEAVKREAKTLCETLFAIREDRTISFTTGEERGIFRIPKTLYRSDLDSCRHELMLVCCYVVDLHGTMVVRLTKKDHSEIFGIRVLPIGVWSPVSKEEMRECQCTGPDGIEVEPEEGVTYTEIMRERF